MLFIKEKKGNELNPQLSSRLFSDCLMTSVLPTAPGTLV